MDSVVAVDMVRHIQAEMPETPIPLTLVYDYPTVREAVAELLRKINGSSDTFLRRKVMGTVWRAVSRALGRDPLSAGRSVRARPDLTEDEAMAVLNELLRAYESKEWLDITRATARQAAFEQRSFLLNLRQKAALLQRSILDAAGFRSGPEGLRDLECALVAASRASSSVRELLLTVRIALQGGPNGMWAVNMESDDRGLWTDVNSMESRALYVKADPFGRDRVNTNSVV